MNKTVIVIGGGISGLSTLHYLHQKYKDRDDIQIHLLEKNDQLGGTIGTIYKDECLFEIGPNGFLDSKESTLRLVRDLGLESELLLANPEAQRRFISLNNTLYELPTNPLSFLKFSPLSWQDKLRVLMEPFIKRGDNPEESVYEFGQRRLGERFVQIFLDPMVSGIFAGDAKQLNLKSSFPRIYEIEQRYGSLLKGMMALAKAQKKASQKANLSGQPGGRLTSFQKGMVQLIHTLHSQYKNFISANQEVKKIHRDDDGPFIIQTEQKTYQANEVFLCAPAYSAAAMVRDWRPHLALALEKIPYAPIAVVGLLYPRSMFQRSPEGFGYLIPSLEGKEVLGVLFSSNIFVNRSSEKDILFRVMMGGSRYPKILQKTESEFISIAQNEIQKMFLVSQDPQKHFFAFWPQAIPQYNAHYIQSKKIIESEISEIEHFHLIANYLGGVALNDCTANAKLAVEKSML